MAEPTTIDKQIFKANLKMILAIVGTTALVVWGIAAVVNNKDREMSDIKNQTQAAIEQSKQNNDLLREIVSQMKVDREKDEVNNADIRNNQRVQDVRLSIIETKIQK